MGTMGTRNRRDNAFDHNLYWNAGQPILFGKKTMAQRQGQDKESLVGDPLFVNPEKGDFHLRPLRPNKLTLSRTTTRRLMPCSFKPRNSTSRFGTSRTREIHEGRRIALHSGSAAPGLSPASRCRR